MRVVFIGGPRVSLSQLLPSIPEEQIDFHVYVDPSPYPLMQTASEQHCSEKKGLTSHALRNEKTIYDEIENLATVR